MDFDKLNNSFEEERTNNKNEIKERIKIIEELVYYSVEHENPISFKSFGLDSESELIKNTKIKKEVLEGLNEDKKNKVKYSLEIFQSFLMDPIFTDSFGLDHPSRRIWETTYIEKGKLSPAAKKCYYSNCLNSVTGWNKVISEIQELEEIILNQSIKDNLENLKSKIPCEFFDKYEVEDKVNVETYHRLYDDEKVEVIKELKKIAKEVILLLTEKQI